MSQSRFNITQAEYSSLTPNPQQRITKTVILNNTEFTEGSENSSLYIYKNEHEHAKLIYSHNTFDIICVCEGEAVISVCGNKMPVSKGSFLFLSPGVPYSVECDEESMVPVFSIEKEMIVTAFHQISCYSGILSGFFANGIWGEASSAYIFFKRVTNPNVYNLIAALVHEELNPEKYSSLLKKNLFLSLIGYINTMENHAYEISAMKIVKSEQIIKILTYIQNNYRNVTLEMLAENFHYTVPYVSKLIRSSTGFTFTDILREIKFDVCLSLLLNSDLKINRIAEVAGFQNTDHFNRIFKKRMGETPSEYRKNKMGIGIDK